MGLNVLYRHGTPKRAKLFVNYSFNFLNLFCCGLWARSVEQSAFARLRVQQSGGLTAA
jgi:hypothetical protein